MRRDKKLILCGSIVLTVCLLYAMRVSLLNHAWYAVYGKYYIGSLADCGGGAMMLAVRARSEYIPPIMVKSDRLKKRIVAVLRDSVYVRESSGKFGNVIIFADKEGAWHTVGISGGFLYKGAYYKNDEARELLANLAEAVSERLADKLPEMRRTNDRVFVLDEGADEETALCIDGLEAIPLTVSVEPDEIYRAFF